MDKNKTATWLAADALQDVSLSPRHWSWVVNTDSLTKRLRHRFGAKIEFHLQKAQIDQVYPEERNLLTLKDKASHWVREIEWRTQDNLLVAARVVIPTGSTNPLMRKLYGIGSVSIGEVLFQPGAFARESMLFAKIVPGHPYFALANAKEELSAGFLWARTSVFVCKQDRLLVSEIFLPNFFASVEDE